MQKSVLGQTEKTKKRKTIKRCDNMGLLQPISFRNSVNIPSTTHATFGLYRYPAKFIPHVIAYILENYNGGVKSVFDPFAGYGTVGVVSKLYGKDYELWDLNPSLKLFHSVSTMKPTGINPKDVLEEMKSSKEEFIPDWTSLNYWFPKEFLPLLYKAWGYYHSLSDEKTKLFLAIPLLKVTRYFSYDDMQRQKLSKSKKSQERTDKLLASEWEDAFYQMLEKEMDKITKGLNEYQELNPKNTKAVIRAGVNTMKEKLKENRDILITSPPYLQSQEYMRQAKLDLFWLGHTEKRVKEIGKLEIPYCDIEPIEIQSKTFLECRSKIEEEHVRKIYDKYFWGILGTFTRLQENINSRMFLFVGHSSARGRAVPIDKIFIEHLTNYGWKHEKTLVDTIVSRRLFAYKVNPASGLKDARTAVENLVILKRA